MKLVLLLPAALLLAPGCGPTSEPLRDERIDCAPEGTADLARACTVERLQGADGTVLTIRHPDGGFRRLLVTDDGRGVIAADGAEEAAVSLVGDALIEVRLAGHRYRLPATVKEK